MNFTILPNSPAEISLTRAQGSGVGRSDVGEDDELNSEGIIEVKKSKNGSSFPPIYFTNWMNVLI